MPTSVNYPLGDRSIEWDAARLRVLLSEVNLPPGATASSWGGIMYIPHNGGTVQSFPVTTTGRDDALTAAGAGGGGIVWVPPATAIAGAWTLPATTVIASMGNKASFTGKGTISGGDSGIKGITVNVSGADAIEITATSGIVYINDCQLFGNNGIEMNGAGGTLYVWNSYVEGTSGVGVKQTAGTVYITDDGDCRGTAGEFSGTVNLFSLDDVIKLKTSTFTKLYNATASGVAAMIAGASSGNRAEFPKHIQIALTSGITVPTGVTLAQPNLSFSGFAGVGVDMGAGSFIENFNIDYDGSGQASATAIRANGVDAQLVRGNGRATNATTNTGILLRGNGASERIVATLIYGYANGGTTSRGVQIEDDVRGVVIRGEAGGGSSSNVGIRFNIDSLDREDYIHGSWGKGVGTNSYGISVVTDKDGRILFAQASGDTKDILINVGAELQVYGIQYDTISQFGTLTLLPGDHTAGGGFLGWFNVKDYGAVGDGVTDDTTAIQDTINAASAAGGGTVYFPAGIYIVGGALQDTSRANAQLLLPTIDKETEQPIGITLLGEHIPALNVTGGGPFGMDFESGAIIKGTLNAGAGGALLGGKSSAASSYPRTRILAELNNLTFRMPSNPVLTAVNLSDVAEVKLVNVAFDVGEDTDVKSLTEPTTTTSYALKTPGNNNGALTFIENIRIVGYYNGIEVNEHSDIDQVHIAGCKNAFVFEFGHHASLMNRVTVSNCTNGMKFNGGHYVDVVQYDVEHSELSVWYTSVYDIDDASNYGKGRVNYHGVLAGTGKGEPFIKNGARNIIISRVGAKQPPVYWEPGVAAGGDTIMFMANQGDICMMRTEVNNG
jgi:hypothetical protein